MDDRNIFEFQALAGQLSKRSAAHTRHHHLMPQHIITACPPMFRSCPPDVQAVAGQPSDRNEARAHEDYHLFVENIYARLDLPTIVPELLKQLGTSHPDLAEAINKDYVCESSWAVACCCSGGIAGCGHLQDTKAAGCRFLVPVGCVSLQLEVSNCARHWRLSGSWADSCGGLLRLCQATLCCPAKGLPSTRCFPSAAR